APASTRRTPNRKRPGTALASRPGCRNSRRPRGVSECLIESFDLLKQVNGILCAGTPVAEKRDFGVGGNGGGKDVVQSLAVRDRASTQFEKVHVLVDALGPERVTHVE